MEAVTENGFDENQDSEDETTLTQKRKSIKSAGIVQKISVENFLCHDKLELEFNEQVNFIIGKNGSGKSAILTGIVVALGERASATSRGQSIKDFIKTGRNRAVVKVTLRNVGQGCYQPELYGDYITIERVINTTGGGGYRILNEHGKVVSTKRADLNRILAKMNLQVDNPVCILNQETAKNFLHSNDEHQKYKLFERATQMDVMCRDFSTAEEELAKSKSCMKEKIHSLTHLMNELKTWQNKKNWYEAINEVEAKKTRLENEMAWAQVEDVEMKMNAALEKQEKQKIEIERTQGKVEEHKEKLVKLQEQQNQKKEERVEKASQVNAARAECDGIQSRIDDVNKQRKEVTMEVRQLEIEQKRYVQNQNDIIQTIDKAKKTHGDSEIARRKEARLQELEALRERQETLNSQRGVSEHQVEQLKGAIEQLKNEYNGVRFEMQRCNQLLDPKRKNLNELKRAGANTFTIFGPWVTTLLERIERTNFRGVKPKGPIGAYVKLRDSSWAPVIESFLGGRMHTFICSTDEDAKILTRLMDEIVPRNQRPQIVTTNMCGRMYDVRANKVYCSPEVQSKGMHCLFDMLIIEDPDVANILIDMSAIEQVLLVTSDSDARYYLSDVNRVPPNCRSAITKDGNTYFPDPNYRSYGGRLRKAQFLQASVQEAIRNLEDEVENIQRETAGFQERARQLTTSLQANDRELRNEDSKLSGIRRELMLINQKITSLEQQKDPEATDILVFEEDLQDIGEKLKKNENDLHLKRTRLEELNEQYKGIKEMFIQKSKVLQELTSECLPLEDTMSHCERRQREIKEVIDKLKMHIITMETKYKEYETTYLAMKAKAESEAAIAEQLCPRVPVTKSLKTLSSELRQIKEQIAAQEKEYGSRDHVMREYHRHKQEYERANQEVTSSQNSLRKMIQMSKRRKSFIARFRSSIETRTHYVFQGLLRTRNFEGEIKFNQAEKTLYLLVTPPGREESSSQRSSSQPPAKRKRDSTATDIKSLSGGERSFATVCFILALWDAIESPFRILDEFDVFMDHVNRRICMDLIIHEARESPGKQFILLTPLGLETHQLGPDVSVFKMADPDRQDMAD